MYHHVVKNGLRLEEAMQLVSMSSAEMEKFQSVFGFLFFEYDGIQVLHNGGGNAAIRRRYLREPCALMKYHSELASFFEKFPLSLRKAEELFYHYTESRNFFRLKDFVSDIEVFSLTYTPHLKHTIVSLWQLLQNQMVDPVFEYNRSLEGFVTSYRPTTKELFGILGNFIFCSHRNADVAFFQRNDRP